MNERIATSVTLPRLSSALRVVQQPFGIASVVTRKPQEVSQFNDVLKYYGSIGLLAHVSLAGAHFMDLKPGDQVEVETKSTRTRIFQVEYILRFQALDPQNTFSNFVSLDADTELLTSGQVAKTAYGKADTLVFQTCIPKDDNPLWARIFFVCNPIS